MHFQKIQSAITILTLGHSIEGRNEGVKPENEGVKPGNEGVNESGKTRVDKAYIRRKSVVRLIRDSNDITLSSLCRILSCSSATIERDILWLKENGHIARKGSDKHGEWIILKDLE